ncbi:excisionase family DNA-binding protein [uncultured Serinicoccus sp.]|uniref:excisionase family DNA-binding protein n=1 Tax=uncultured Serinicoccus sp. TaxID=735514 RepID=UPI00345BA298
MLKRSAPWLVGGMSYAMERAPTKARHYESLAAAAERTGMSIRTLRRRIAEGQLPAYRSGPRLIRVNPADVDRLMVQIPSL